MLLVSTAALQVRARVCAPLHAQVPGSSCDKNRFQADSWVNAQNVLLVNKRDLSSLRACKICRRSMGHGPDYQLHPSAGGGNRGHLCGGNRDMLKGVGSRHQLCRCKCGCEKLRWV